MQISGVSGSVLVENPQDTLNSDVLYFQTHGLMAVAPEKLNKVLTLAIDQMHKSLYGGSARELTAAEANVLQAGGFDLNESTTSSAASNRNSGLNVLRVFVI
jgi:hypothetical protein